jgi:hypothetical protein
MDTEIWKDVQGFEGLYMVSSHARVLSLGRTIEYPLKGRSNSVPHLCRRTYPQKYLKPFPSGLRGDVAVDLLKDGKSTTYLISRLVAQHFVPNLENKEEVNHKDHDCTNNHFSNLEWVTRAENIEYSLKAGVFSHSTIARKIYRYSLDGQLLAIYDSIRKAGNALKVKNTSAIVRCAKKQIKTAYGCVWSYEAIFFRVPKPKPLQQIALDLEEWKDIEGFEGLYQISSLGRVQSLERKCPGGNNIRTVPAKILSMGNSRGYNLVHLAKNGKMYPFRVHCLVAKHFIPNPENKPLINHKNLDKKDNRQSNLEWTTPSENTNHYHQSQTNDFVLFAFLLGRSG